MSSNLCPRLKRKPLVMMEFPLPVLLPINVLEGTLKPALGEIRPAGLQVAVDIQQHGLAFSVELLGLF